jgi:nitrous oxide reductase
MRLECGLSRRRFLQGLATMAAVASSTRGWGVAGAAFAAGNATQTENAKPGSADWELTQVALNGEIEGYASRASVGRGEQIQFSVNTTIACAQPPRPSSLRIRTQRR